MTIKYLSIYLTAAPALVPAAPELALQLAADAPALVPAALELAPAAPELAPAEPPAAPELAPAEPRVHVISRRVQANIRPYIRSEGND